VGRPDTHVQSAGRSFWGGAKHSRRTSDNHFDKQITQLEKLRKHYLSTQRALDY